MVIKRSWNSTDTKTHLQRLIKNIRNFILQWTAWWGTIRVTYCDQITSKFCEAARGLVNRRLQPRPVSTHILVPSSILTDFRHNIGTYSPQAPPTPECLSKPIMIIHEIWNHWDYCYLTFPEFINGCSRGFGTDIEEYTNCQIEYIVHWTANSSLLLGSMIGPNALKNQRWLLSFFLFCSLRQKRTWIGHNPWDTSPVSVTTTLVVYLPSTSTTAPVTRENRLTRRCVLSHLSQQLNPWRYPLGNNPSDGDN